MNEDQLRSNFLAGRYSQVIEITGKHPLKSSDSSFFALTSIQLGSMVFLGDLKEAQILFDKSQSLSPPTWFNVHCQFYLGIGHVRYSQFKRAAHLFTKNLSLIRSQKVSKTTLFQTYQGAAFYKMSKGQFDRSIYFAEKAYLAAFEAGHTYGEILALEILAICHCQTGKVRLGLHEFDKSLKLVKKIGNGGIETALKVSRIRYRSFYGVNRDGGEEEIREALKELRPEDTYSKADLALELARQMLLRGKVSETQKLLDETCDLVYKHQNKKQTALFNHRYAYLLFLKGEDLAALSLLRMAILNIDPEFDSVTHRQFEGLIQKISNQPLSNHSYKNFADGRIQKRAKGEMFITIKGEDPVGDLIDSLSQSGHMKLAEIKRQGLFGLIPRALRLSSSSSAMVFGPERGQLIIISKGDVFCLDSGLTTPMRRLISLLSGAKFQTKEYLVEKTWGYAYSPLTHDKLIYATIAKLRNLLGPFSSALEWSPEGYRISPDFRILDPFLDGKDRGPETLLPSKKKRKKSKSLKTQLNLRQIKALKLTETGEALDVTSYSKKFKVSKMTACRDLTMLSDARLLTKVGKARATKYVGEEFL